MCVSLACAIFLHRCRFLSIALFYLAPVLCRIRSLDIADRGCPQSLLCPLCLSPLIVIVLPPSYGVAVIFLVPLCAGAVLSMIGLGVYTLIPYSNCGRRPSISTTIPIVEGAATSTAFMGSVFGRRRWRSSSSITLALPRVTCLLGLSGCTCFFMAASAVVAMFRRGISVSSLTSAV